MIAGKTEVPFLDLLGIQVTQIADGQSELAIDITEQHMNSWQVAHGGLLLTMVDAAMAVAARSYDAADRSVVTIELKHSFLQAAVTHARAKGRVIHATPTMAFCEATILDNDDKICGHATGTFKYFKRLPTRLEKN